MMTRAAAPVAVATIAATIATGATAASDDYSDRGRSRSRSWSRSRSPSRLSPERPGRAHGSPERASATERSPPEWSARTRATKRMEVLKSLSYSIVDGHNAHTYASEEDRVESGLIGRDRMLNLFVSGPFGRPGTRTDQEAPGFREAGGCPLQDEAERLVGQGDQRHG